jgi:uncharacterized protein (TIGR03437 family)
VTVAVQTPLGLSYSATVLKQKLSPVFLTYQSGSQTYAMAVHLDGSTVGPLGPSSRLAVPGDTIEIFGTRFRETNPPVTSAPEVFPASPTSLPAAMSIGGVSATVEWAA